MTIAEASRQYQVALEYRRRVRNEIGESAELENAEEALLEAKSELDRIWCEGLL